MDAVGLHARSPDVLGTISQILGIRSQQQALQGQAAEVAGAQQTQRQREGLAKHDWNQYVGEDGTLDLEMIANDQALRQAAGDQILSILQNASAVKASQIEAKRQLFGMRTDQREELATLLGSLRGDKDIAEDTPAGRRKVNDALIQFGEIHGPDVFPVLSSYAGQLTTLPEGQLGNAISMVQRQAMTPESQRGATLPSYQSTGRQLVNVNPDVLPGAGGPIGLQTPPSAQIISDVAGRQHVIDPALNNPRLIGGGGGGSVSPSASPSQRPGGFEQPVYQGQAQDIAAYQDQVRSVRDAADQAPVQRDTFRKIMNLSEGTSTGPLVKFFQDTRIGGQIFGDDYQQLAKYLERNAISAMQAMGGPASDSRLAAATAATGSTGFNKEALREVTQFNYAANTGLEMYRRGLDKAIGTNNPDYLKLPEFKAAWADNFDINAFMLENAINDGDKKAQDKILSSLSKEQAANLMRKIRNLDSLSETGRLSQ